MISNLKGWLQLSNERYNFTGRQRQVFLRESTLSSLKYTRTTMASITASPAPTSSETSNGKNYRGPFAIMTSLFFLWGFMTVFNDILIPRFKDAFKLDYSHAMLVQFAFFGAY